MKQLGRFLRLERARKEGEHEEAPLPRRFTTLEDAAGAPSTTTRSGAALERFAPEPDPTLELEPPDLGQPFVRCLHCGADSERHATVCGQCEARLDSEQVHAFNAELWAKQTATRNQEVLEEHRRHTFATDATDAQRRQLGEALAVEVAAREEARLSVERPSFGTASSWSSLASGVQAPRAGVTVAIGSAALLFSLLRHGRFGFWGPLLAAAAVLVVIWLRRR